jgi:hypothetical protein
MWRFTVGQAEIMHKALRMFKPEFYARSVQAAHPAAPEPIIYCTYHPEKCTADPACQCYSKEASRQERESEFGDSCFACVGREDGEAGDGTYNYDTYDYDTWNSGYNASSLSGSGGGENENSCEYAYDGECDYPDEYCLLGTDESDCAGNTCRFAFDGACDEPEFCPKGTDTYDCAHPAHTNGLCTSDRGYCTDDPACTCYNSVRSEHTFGEDIGTCYSCDDYFGNYTGSGGSDDIYGDDDSYYDDDYSYGFSDDALQVEGDYCEHYWRDALQGHDNDDDLLNDFDIEDIITVLCTSADSGSGMSDDFWDFFSEYDDDFYDSWYRSGSGGSSETAHDFGFGGDDSCIWSNDLVCDVPMLCDPGTDASDCDNVFDDVYDAGYDDDDWWQQMFSGSGDWWQSFFSESGSGFLDDVINRDSVSASCSNRDGTNACGKKDFTRVCMCHQSCQIFGDCCADYSTVCGAPTVSKRPSTGTTTITATGMVEGGPGVDSASVVSPTAAAAITIGLAITLF